ncbi:YlxM family DNA-binding protein [Spiroplasma taiwanense]|nr:sigma factor-like helix-turn-helix DNA-binding protein [Spiroplasma taiwanense]
MNNNDIVKSVLIGQLYDFYKSLLTDKQQKYFELYFFEDLTLQEIAQEFNISRNAVYDSISKTSNLLIDFEQKLTLKNKSDKLREIIENYKNNKLSKEEFILELEGDT